jgi:hypothetical protein
MKTKVTTSDQTDWIELISRGCREEDEVISPLSRAMRAVDFAISQTHLVSGVTKIGIDSRRYMIGTRNDLASRAHDIL